MRPCWWFWVTSSWIGWAVEYIHTYWCIFTCNTYFTCIFLCNYTRRFGPFQNNEKTDVCDFGTWNASPAISHGNKATSIQSLWGQRLECSMHPIFGQDAAGRQMASLALLDLWQSLDGAQRKGLKYAEVFHVSVWLSLGFWTTAFISKGML